MQNLNKTLILFLLLFFLDANSQELENSCEFEPLSESERSQIENLYSDTTFPMIIDTQFIASLNIKTSLSYRQQCLFLMDEDGDNYNKFFPDSFVVIPLFKIYENESEMFLTYYKYLGNLRYEYVHVAVRSPQSELFQMSTSFYKITEKSKFTPQEYTYTALHSWDNIVMKKILNNESQGTWIDHLENGSLNSVDWQDD